MENKDLGLIILCFLSMVYTQGQAQSEVCYRIILDGNAYLILDHEFEYTNRLDISLSFSTSQDEGLIYYKEGNYDQDDGALAFDFEALFIRNSTLNYFVFNPKVTGTGATYGCHLKTDFNVSNATWYEVEFFRNKEMEVGNDDGEMETVTKTGMKVNGQSFLVEDYMGGIGELELKRESFIGGFTNMGRLNIKKFNGEIKQVRDVISQGPFPKPMAVPGGTPDDVIVDCLEFPVPS